MSEDLLNELQLLTSMYDPSDVKFHDPEVLKLVENCIPISDSVSLTLRLNESVQLDFRLPLGYPEKERLSAYCKVSRTKGASNMEADLASKVMQWELQFNKGLSDMLMGVASGPGGGGADEYPKILGVIQWCNEQFEICPIPMHQSNESLDSTGNPSRASNKQSSESCRIWIYSHHIYNKNKRKFLVNTAEELDLAGFSLPGKPGFVCVEGDPSSCDEYWGRVRQLTWQKISLVERQIFPESEIIFENKPFEEMHCDKSAFIKFLEAKNASQIIKDYLGI